MFRLLGTAPGNDITAEAAAALIRLPLAHARQLLDHLVDTCQLQQRIPGRYEQHDLIRVYARELADAHEPDGECLNALRGLLHWYLATLHHARVALDPLTRGPCEMTGHPHALAFADRAGAIAWLESERLNLIAAIETAHAAGEYRYVWRSAENIAMYLSAHRPWDHSIPLIELGLTAARRDNDRRGEAAMLNSLGDAYYFRGEHEASLRATRHALTIYREIGDTKQVVGMLSNLSHTLEAMGSHREAIECKEQALAAAVTLADPRVEAFLLSHLASGYRAAGRYGEAIEAGERGASVSRAVDYRIREADCLDEIGRAYVGLGELHTAVSYFEQALAVYDGLEESRMAVQTYLELGAAYRRLGETGSARRTWQAAVRIMELNGNPDVGQARALLATLES